MGKSVNQLYINGHFQVRNLLVYQRTSRKRMAFSIGPWESSGLSPRKDHSQRTRVLKASPYQKKRSTRTVFEDLYLLVDGWISMESCHDL